MSRSGFRAVLGTLTLFIDGEVYRGSYAAVDLVDALG